MGYKTVTAPDHPNAAVNGKIAEHVLIASAALGKPLPAGVDVHHVNGDPQDNRPENLVICEDRAYHMLLHRRQRALDGCGHAGWVRCYQCRRWCDPADPEVTVVTGRSHMAYHKSCNTSYQKAKERGVPLAEWRRLTHSGRSARDTLAAAEG